MEPQAPVSDGQWVPSAQEDGLVSTVEAANQAEIAAEKAKAADEEAAAKKAEEEAAAKAKENVPFHEHPRWKEVMDERRALAAEVANLKGQIQAVTAAKPAEAQGEKKKGFLDTYESDEELEEALRENPRSFLAKFAEDVEARLKTAQEKAAEEKAADNEYERSMEQYAKDNPNFLEMFQNGDLQRFIAKNPAHNLVSAHLALTIEAKQKDFDAKVEAAIAEKLKGKEEELVKNFRLKQGARVIPAGPASGGRVVEPGVSPELKNPAKFGGTVSALLARSRARRAAQGR
jgi:hypothetical protein